MCSKNEHKKKGLGHESFDRFVKDAYAKNEVFDAEAFVDAVHAFFVLVIGFLRNHRVEAIADAACFSEES